MDFNKLTKCDRGDMQSWASSNATWEFASQLIKHREIMICKLISSPTEVISTEIKTLDSVLRLIEETKKNK